MITWILPFVLLFEPAVFQNKKGAVGEFEGTWVAIKSEFDGKPLNSYLVSKFKVQIEGNIWTSLGPFGERQEYYVKWNTKTDPKEIDLTEKNGQEKGETVYGIYAFDQQVLEVCFSQPGKKRPTEFKTSKGSGQSLHFQKKEK